MNTIYFFIKKITICLIFLGVQTVVVASDPTQPSCSNSSCIKLVQQLEKSKQDAALGWKSYDEEKEKVGKLEQAKVLEFSKNHANTEKLKKLEALKLDTQKLIDKQTTLTAQEEALRLREGTLKEEREKLQQQIEANKTTSSTVSPCEKCDNYQLRLAEMSLENDQSKETLKNLTQELSTTQEKNTQHTSAIAGFQERDSKSLNEITQLKNSVNTEQEKSKKLNQRLEVAVAAKIEAEKLATQHQEKNAILEEGLASLQSVHKEGLESLKLQHEKELEKRKTSYEGQLDAQQALAITQKRQELNSLQESNQQLTAEIEELKKQYNADSKRCTENYNFLTFIYNQLNEIQGNNITNDNHDLNITQLQASIIKSLQDVSMSLNGKKNLNKDIPALKDSISFYKGTSLLATGTAIVLLLMLLRMYKMQSGHA